MSLSERIWSEPLTESERSIIMSHLTGTPGTETWFRFLLAVYDAREQALANVRTEIARQLTPLDVAATHIDILRKKSDDYTPQERDNVAAIVETNVREARHALFAVIKDRA